MRPLFYIFWWEFFNMQASSIAHRELLASSDVTEQQLNTVLGTMMGGKIDFAELFLQQHYQESWILEDSIIKEGAYHIERGLGARAMSGERTGFAYTDDIELFSLQNAAKAARSIAYQSDSKVNPPAFKSHDYNRLYSADNPLNSLNQADKLAILKSVDTYARARDPRIVQVNASLSGVYDIVLILNSDGLYTHDIRPLVRLNVSVIAEHQGRREQGFAGGGGRFDYQELLKNNTAINFAEEAVRVALLSLEARPAPAGVMPVVMGPGWSGVLLHEAVGHGLEGDFNRKGVSAFSGRIGEKVASECCTIVDDGTLLGRRGSLNIDDEGTPTQQNILIENGVLRGYMQDKLNARLMGVAPTGNARRESYAHLTLPRMTNTYLMPGKHSPEEIMSSLERGLYIVGLGGGSVDITSGKFVFSTSEAYWVEQGKIQYPVKGATLIGAGPEVMQAVSMVGNDLQLDSGVGICGKDGQSVPVGVGQPTIRIEQMTVGGTQN